MSYDVAKKMFAENIAFSTPANTWEKVQAHNLNKGLTQLTEALAQDMSHLEAQISQLQQAIQRLSR